MLQGAISDGEYSKTVLKMLVRRLKEVGQERISSGSLAAGIKTIAVWHRCLNVGDKSFLGLSAQYAHLIEPPQGNALAAMYSTYIRAFLKVFGATKHIFHKDVDPDESKLSKLGIDVVVAITPLLMEQMKALLRCDLQGGLMDAKTRASVHYAINMLILDSMGLFMQIDAAMDRIRASIGSLEPEQAQAMATLYEKYTKLPNHMLNLLKQVCLDSDVTPPSSRFDQKGMRDFKAKIEAVQVPLLPACVQPHHRHESARQNTGMAGPISLHLSTLFPPTLSRCHAVTLLHICPALKRHHAPLTRIRV